MFVPKLVTTLREYDRRQLTSDLTAGVIVGIVAFPLAIAFAIASGVTPERGLYTAIVAGFIISVLGGSRVQIGGPTGAFVVVVYSIVQRYGLPGLSIATLMAGVIMVLLGVFKLGTMIKFIPHPLVTGFTSGIGVLIAVNEVRDFFGLQVATMPAEFVEKIETLALAAGTTNWWALGIAVFTLALLIVWRQLNVRIPGPFVALVVTSAAVQLFNLPVDTIGSRFGVIDMSFPAPSIPAISFADLRGLVGPAFTIAALGSIESLLSAMVADGMIGGRHRSNMELVAQGVANIASPIFGGIPATGAIARTATNVKNGGRTPIAGIAHAVTLVLIALLLGRWAALVPMATLAGILMLVAYQMSEWRVFRAELRGPREDAAVLLSTFFLTVIIDLTVAIAVGMVLAAFLFMKRMAETTNVAAVTRALRSDGDDVTYSAPGAISQRDIPQRVEVFEISGPFFFGAAEAFKEALGQIAGRPWVIIIRMRDVNLLDSSGLHALQDVVRRFRRDKTIVLLSEVHAQPLQVIQASDLFHELGEDMFMDIDDALDRARAHVATRTTGSTPVAGPAA
ncbi:MAG: sulfate transporter [Geminicoccaceae bacterium]|nr:sulfate transporter [Geminicoccaceae bacterium]